MYACDPCLKPNVSGPDVSDEGKFHTVPVLGDGCRTTALFHHQTVGAHADREHEHEGHTEIQTHLVVVPTCGMQMWLGLVIASRIFPTLNITAHLKTPFCYREEFIAHPATTLRVTRR